MLAPISWLKEYVDLPPLETLVERLNQTGTTVAAIHKFGEGLEAILVGEILEVVPHPNADKLQLATVQIPGKKLSIVCGARNIAAGQKVPVAQIGTSVPVGKDGVPMKIERIKIRDIESEGMLCSAKELGLGDDHSGILILDENLRIGTPLTTALTLPETVLETEVTTNRGDELSIYGLASEIAAVTGAKHTPLKAKSSEVELKSQFKLAVRVADHRLCPRYSAQVVTDLKIGPSPAWMQLRLRESGMRPINNIVDVTNYVMLLTGQPLHAFDYSKVTGGGIIVRESKTGDRVTTLDGVTRLLGFGTIVIADKEKVLGLGGVMGGEDSGIGELTDTVVLESAIFNPVAIRQTAMKYNLRSEASLRFERGVEMAGTVRSLNLAVELLKEYAGGFSASGVIDIYPEKYQPAKVTLTSTKLNQYLGYNLPLVQAEAILTKLGLLTVSRTKDKLIVKVPSWRARDISIEEDLIEEVARVSGYDAIPSSLPTGAIPEATAISAIQLIRTIKDHLTSLGLTEVSVYPMVSESLLGEDVALKISNSISKEWGYLRTSLIPGVTQTAAMNLNLGSDPAIFEVGKVYLPKEADLPYEREALAVIGPDFVTAKGYLESLFEKLNLPAARFSACSAQYFSEDSAATVEVGNKLVGEIGELSPTWAEKTGLHRRLTIAEIDLTELMKLTSSQKSFRSIAKYPSVHEDISIVVAVSTPIGEITDGILLYSGAKYLVSVEAFDIFADPRLGGNKKSVSLSLTFQAEDKTLTDNDVRADRKKIEELLKENFKVKIR